MIRFEKKKDQTKTIKENEDTATQKTPEKGTGERDVAASTESKEPKDKA